MIRTPGLNEGLTHRGTESNCLLSYSVFLVPLFPRWHLPPRQHRILQVCLPGGLHREALWKSWVCLQSGSEGVTWGWHGEGLGSVVPWCLHGLSKITGNMDSPIEWISRGLGSLWVRMSGTTPVCPHLLQILLRNIYLRKIRLQWPQIASSTQTHWERVNSRKLPSYTLLRPGVWTPSPSHGLNFGDMLQGTIHCVSVQSEALHWGW